MCVGVRCGVLSTCIGVRRRRAVLLLLSRLFLQLFTQEVTIKTGRQQAEEVADFRDARRAAIGREDALRNVVVEAVRGLALQEVDGGLEGRGHQATEHLHAENRTVLHEL